MKLPPLGWALFGVAVLLVAGYAFNRGLFIGSEMLPEPITTMDGRKLTLYAKRCHYLHFAGTGYRQTVGEEGYGRVSEVVCPMFDD